MKEKESKKNEKDLEIKAKQRIKVDTEPTEIEQLLVVK